MRGDGLALAASVVRGGFLYALKNILPFRGVSKWCFLVNEMSMVFFGMGFLRYLKFLGKGGRQYGVFILGKVRLKG
ncbi:hypothetical protein ABH892_001733 [Paenibacillus sp. RC254]